MYPQEVEEHPPQSPLKGERPRDVATEMQISLNAVVTAKSRVLKRLRQEAEGLVDSSSGFLV